MTESCVSEIHLTGVNGGRNFHKPFKTTKAGSQTLSLSPHCEHCKNQIPKAASTCPHCGKPGLYPNVRAAEDPLELAEVERRYNAAVTDADERGAGHILRDFEKEMENSVAVLARSANELQRLSTSDNEIYATYYALLKAGIISFTDDKWPLLRSLADEALFPGYKDNIRFAALTLDGRGLSNYGNCFVMLRTSMISHRASVFEENSTIFMDHHKILMSKAHNLPRGYRVNWDNRGKLCVAKLHCEIDENTSRDEYSEKLLRQGATTEDDDFVEVHIWGPMTVRTFKKVTIRARPRRSHRAIVNALQDKLSKVSVSVEVI